MGERLGTGTEQSLDDLFPYATRIMEKGLLPDDAECVGTHWDLRQNRFVDVYQVQDPSTDATEHFVIVGDYE